MAAAPSTTKSPKQVTIYGRLSYPSWTAQAAYDLGLKGQYPAKDVASAAPHFDLLLEPKQLEKLMTHIEQVFLPYCVQQHAAGEKKDVLDASEVKALLDGLHGDLTLQVYNTPIKAVNDKTQPLAPETVAAVKIIGNKGRDFELKAIVNDEDELAVPDPDRLQYPVILPINETAHSMYAGAYVAVTGNLYAYHNGKHPGFSMGASVAVFKADGDQIGGGVAMDEDELFVD